MAFIKAALDEKHHGFETIKKQFLATQSLLKPYLYIFAKYIDKQKTMEEENGIIAIFYRI